MNATINLLIKMNSNKDATSAVSVITEIALKRTPESPNEINNFLDGIVVEGSTITARDNYSLMSCTFRELIPQIMTELARYNFGSICMDACYQSYNCGYEAVFKGLILKSGKCKTSFIEIE